MDADERIKWYRCPIEKEQLAELTQRQNLRPLIHITAQLLFSALTGFGVYLAWRYLSWPFWVAAIYIHCSFFEFFTPAAAIHELSHYTVFKSRWLNEFFIFVCSFLTWTNPVKFRASHLQQHHPNTLFEDRDHEVSMPIIVRPIDIFFCLTVPLYSIQNVIGIFELFDEFMRHCFGLISTEQDKRLFPESKPRLRRQLFNWARVVVVGHVILAILFIYFDLWILLFVVTFARIIAPGLGLLCTFPQHLGLMYNVPDFRMCCRTMVLGKFMRFFYWNMNYHTEHHMYAAVPYYNLPKLHEIIKDDMPPSPNGLGETWKQLWPIIQRQWTDPDYCFVQDAPHPHVEQTKNIS